MAQNSEVLEAEDESSYPDHNECDVLNMYHVCMKYKVL